MEVTDSVGSETIPRSGPECSWSLMSSSWVLLKRSSTAQQSPVTHVTLTLPLQNQGHSKVPGLLHYFWKGPSRMTGTLCYQYTELRSRLGEWQWSLGRTDSSLATKCPQVQSARSRGVGSSGSSLSQACGVPHQSYTGKGTWLWSSGHLCRSVCYFLGFSRMFRNLPLVISLDSSSPSW